MADCGVTCIDLVRHGEVATPGLFCASPTEPLSDKGWQQLRDTTFNVCGISSSHRGDSDKPDNDNHYDVMLSSPSRRCAEFAATLASKFSCEPELVSGWQEMDFGRWVGQPTHVIWQQDEALLRALWQKPLDFTAPEGESMVEFAERVKATWQDTLQCFANQRVLAFTHGGVMRVLLGMALGMHYQHTLRFELAYGSAVRFKVYADGAVSVSGTGITRL